MYQGFFGVVTMIVEAKNWDCFDHFKPWMTEWFRFLTVPAGKGAFYLFVGSLGVSLWLRNFFSFIVGLYMSFMGVVCIAVHAGNTWKPQYGIEDDHVYGNAVQRDDTLTAVFHDSEDHVYDERDGGAIVTATMRPDTTTTSSGHSLIPGGKKNGKRYAPHDSSTMSTMGMTTYWPDKGNTFEWFLQWLKNSIFDVFNLYFVCRYQIIRPRLLLTRLLMLLTLSSGIRLFWRLFSFLIQSYLF